MTLNRGMKQRDCVRSQRQMFFSTKRQSKTKKSEYNQGNYMRTREEKYPQNLDIIMLKVGSTEIRICLDISLFKYTYGTVGRRTEILFFPSRYVLDWHHKSFP